MTTGCGLLTHLKELPSILFLYLFVLFLERSNICGVEDPWVSCWVGVVWCGVVWGALPVNDPINTPIATWAIASISGGLLTRVIVAVLTPLYIASPVRDHQDWMWLLGMLGRRRLLEWSTFGGWYNIMILHGMTERTLDLLQIARANHFVLHSDHNQSTNAEQITPQSSPVQVKTYHRTLQPLKVLLLGPSIWDLLITLTQSGLRRFYSHIRYDLP